MTTRTVIGTLYHPVGGGVWVGANLAFMLLTPFGAGSSSYPGETTTVTTDGSGNFSTALVVPDDAATAARYRASISATGVAPTVFEFNLSSGASINLATLLIGSMTSATPNSLQALLDAALSSYQPLDSDLTAIAALSTTTYGRSLLAAADAAAARTLIGAIPFTIPIREAYSTQAWTSMPAALTEFNGNTQGRIKADLTNATQARLLVKVMSTPGPSGSELRAQYSTDETNWFYLDNTSGPATSITSANVTAAGSWINLVAGAKADVFLRVVGINGDGATSPSFGNISIQVR